MERQTRINIMHQEKPNRRFILTVILLSIIPLIGLSLLIKTVFTSLLKNLPQNETKNFTTNTTTETLPISPDDPHVLTSFVIYNFSGKVSDISASDIVLDSSLPRFPTSSTTKVYRASINDKEGQKAKYSDIKKNASVVLSTTYNTKSKTWYVTQIVIQ